MTFLLMLELISEFILTLIMIWFFSRIMTPKINKYRKIYTVIIIIIYTVIPSDYIINIVEKSDENNIFIFIFFYYSLVFIYPLLFKKGRISEKIFLSSLYISIITGSSFIINILGSKMFNIMFSGFFIDVSYKRIIIILINRFFQIIITYYIFYNINFIKYIKFIKQRTLYVGGAILLISNILMFIIKVDSGLNGYKISVNIKIIALSLCIIQILSLYILNIFSEEIEERFILRINLNRKNYDKEIKDMYEELIGWKHDFRNHINMIYGLLQVSTKEDVISYINEIDNSISKLDKNIYTDNIYINSILISKTKVAKEKGIKLNLDLRINSPIIISNVDICIILGNLIDNSIEACDNINGYKFIDLKIVSENNMLVIKLNNSTDGYVNEVKGKFLSTKNKNISGIGLIQVDNMVKKYNGYINRKHENNIFTTYIMICSED